MTTNINKCIKCKRFIGKSKKYCSVCQSEKFWEIMTRAEETAREQVRGRPRARKVHAGPAF